MQRALFIIACNYRNNRAVRPLQVGRDMVGLGGFFEHVAGYDRVQILQDETRETVLHALNEELKFLKPGDLLVIYFGGHGVQTTEQLLVLPPGANDPPEAALGFLPVAELRRHTDGRGLIRAMILDSCRNEDAHSNPVTSAAAAYSRRVEVTGGHRDVGVTSIPPRPAGAGKGSFAIFSACSQGEVAPELGASGKGLFSTALQNVLKQAHKAGRRTRLDDDLREQVEGEMHRLADAHGIAYKPQPYKEGNGTPELVSGTMHQQSPATSLPQREPEKAVTPLERIIKNSIGMELVRIEPGSFLMGSPPSELERGNDETQHKVTLTSPFFMAATAVTQRQWKAVLGEGDNPSHYKGDDLPVVSVSWDDAVEFCEKLSQIEGKKYRLPTEAEWEYACRACTTTAFNTGGTISTELANYNGSKGYGRGNIGEYRQKTVPVRTFKPNAWGLYEMHGNVFERCSDGYGPYGGDTVDPKGASDASSRVLRGGSWNLYPSSCRAAYRNWIAPDHRGDSVGFRVCLDL